MSARKKADADVPMIAISADVEDEGVSVLLNIMIGFLFAGKQ